MTVFWVVTPCSLVVWRWRHQVSQKCWYTSKHTASHPSTIATSILILTFDGHCRIRAYEYSVSQCVLLKPCEVGLLSYNFDNRSGWSVPLCSRDCGAANRLRVPSSISYRKPRSKSRCQIKNQPPTCCCRCHGYRLQATNDFPARNNIDLYRRTVVLHVRIHGWDSSPACILYFMVDWISKCNS